MSILSKLSRINEKNSAVLSDVHELTELDHELRLRYLVAIALGIAISRDVSVEEVDAFNGFANSLHIDEEDAQEILNERASISEEDLETIFIFLKNQECIHYYLRDLSWIMCVDHEKDDAEIEYLREVSTLLSVPIEAIDALYVVMSSVRERTPNALISNTIKALNSHPKLYEVALPNIKKIYSVDSLINDRWVENGDDTWTDLKTGLIWLRPDSSYFYGGLKSGLGYRLNYPNSDFDSLMSRLKRWRESKSIELSENTKEHLEWRYPTAAEVADIHSFGRIPEHLLVKKYNQGSSEPDDEQDDENTHASKYIFLNKITWAEHVDEEQRISPVYLNHYLSIDKNDVKFLVMTSYQKIEFNSKYSYTFISNIGSTFLLCKRNGEF